MIVCVPQVHTHIQSRRNSVRSHVLKVRNAENVGMAFDKSRYEELLEGINGVCDAVRTPRYMFLVDYDGPGRTHTGAIEYTDVHDSRLA